MAIISDNTTNSNDYTQNPGSIFYLHPIDQANNRLVSNPFTGENFGKWKRSMLITLTAKNKVCFIDGSLPKPSITSKDYKTWERYNNMVIGWILASLDESISSSVFYHKLASDMWKELEERFGQPSSAHLYSLQEKLATIEHKEGMSIAEFFTQIKSIWDEMDNAIPLPTCSCCDNCVLDNKFIKIQSDQRILHFLMKIDDRFENVRSNILMMEDLPSISQIYRILQQEETHKMMNKQHHTPNIEPTAFTSTKRQNQESTYDGQISKGSNKQGKTQSSNSKRNYFCDHCKITGHTVSRCFKLHGYLNQSKSKRAAVVMTSNEDIMQQSGLSEDQFSRLMNLIGKQQDDSHNNDSHYAEFASNSTMAGPFNEKTYASW